MLMSMMMMATEKMNMVLVYFVHCHQSLQGLFLSFHWQLKQICLIQVLGNGHDDNADLDQDVNIDLDKYFSTEEVRRACLVSPVSDACAHLWENLNQLTTHMYESIAKLWKHFMINPVGHMMSDFIPPQHWSRLGSSSGCSLLQKSPVVQFVINVCFAFHSIFSYLMPTINEFLHKRLKNWHLIFSYRLWLSWGKTHLEGESDGLWDAGEVDQDGGAHFVAHSQNSNNIRIKLKVVPKMTVCLALTGCWILSNE